ncbi:MAG: HNH endonuclease [Thermomicrobiales bacterium]
MARASRRLVQERDGYRCTICGSREQLEVHHIVPRRLGGSNDPENLVTVCAACHRRMDRESLERDGSGHGAPWEAGLRGTRDSSASSE